MGTTLDLATLEGHKVEVLKHRASAIIYSEDSTGDISVEEAITNVEADVTALEAAVEPAIADNACDPSVNIGDFVYVDAAAVLQPALADDISTSKVLGVIIDDGPPCVIKATGGYTGFTGLIPGDRYFLSETVPGGIQNTVPTTSGHVIKLVGTALSSTTLFIDTSQPLTIRT